MPSLGSSMRYSPMNGRQSRMTTASASLGARPQCPQRNFTIMKVADGCGRNNDDD